jgi:hypothetical protein
MIALTVFIIQHQRRLPSMSKSAISLASADAAQCIGNPEIQLFASMDEPYPCDPGNPSGALLTIMGAGEFTTVIAGIGAHCIGWLDQIDEPGLLNASLEALHAGVAVRLPEVYGDGSNLFSGATLKLRSGEDRELRLEFGTHCFGVLSGRLLATFLNALGTRISDTRA